MLDMEKAFDRVWHEELIYKLSKSNLPPRLLHIISSFLANRQITVAVEGALSTSRPVQAGVPQGSCLSPSLYAAYANDVPALDGVKLALYADDTAYISTSINANHAAAKLQPTLDALGPWLEKWRLRVNVVKTQAMVTGRRHRPPPPITILGETVPWAQIVKYLGVTIDARLCMNAHVTATISKTKSARAQLRPLLRSQLPIKTKMPDAISGIQP
ncbi:hypothetical protein evm_012743 [Chilo suppressalis]|nr:hypothetical protein evm_012743 [Chilo suppressalis]